MEASVHLEDRGSSTARHHLLTVGLEDYFHVGAFHRVIRHREWYRFETRLERGVLNTLALLDDYDIHATFFALGWVADEAPEIIRLVTDRGHEIASKGYFHRNFRQLSPDEFWDDLARSREALQRASGQKVIGYRLADRWFGRDDLWALEVLARQGFEYDSSLGPIFREFASEPWRRFSHQHKTASGTIWEFPISSAQLLGIMLPIAGGNYFRQLPHALVKRAVAHWMRTSSTPFVMYFHTWELDPDQPKINGVPLHQHIRQYRNLDQVPTRLRHYFDRYRFTGVARHLGVPIDGAPVGVVRPPQDVERPRVRLTPQPPPSSGTNPRVGLSVVIPCHNEELILPYLANTLKSVKDSLRFQYEMEFVFVDDGSSDGTWEALRSIFGTWDACTIVRHPTNRGVAQGILTGIGAAKHEIVCSIDCDCTYDPHELQDMIPLLTDGVDIVTASPYHPQGGVRNVPRWRLALSKSASALYRRVLRQKLSTYTACFRAYRREAVAGLTLRYGGFLGTVEMLALLDLQGRRIVEYPTTLEVRLLGRSKMKTLRTIFGHLRLLAALVALRLTGNARRARGPRESQLTSR